MSWAAAPPPAGPDAPAMPASGLLAGRPLVGVDFSGAADAGRRLWVAEGRLDAGGRLTLLNCRPARELPGGGLSPPQALAALRAFLLTQPDAAVGVDVPFGVPAALMGEEEWLPFVLAVARRWSTPQAFRAACRAAAGGRELRRLTDREAGTPFSPYNLRLYRQTYFALALLLAPLVAAGEACVLPLQSPRAGRPWLLEVCPAVTLRRLGLYRPYKGPSPALAAAREALVTGLQERAGLMLPDPELARLLVADPGGDALDSVVAALAVARALQQPGGLLGPLAEAGPEAQTLYRREGYVYG